MKKFNFYILMVMAGLMATLSGCKKEPLLPYTGGDRVCFQTHAANYSFFEKSVAEYPTNSVRLKLYIMGFSKPYDRTVTGAALDDDPNTPEAQRLTTAAPSDYRILGGVIPANSVEGWFDIELINQDKLAIETLRLNLAITENEHFLPGLKENYTYRLTWSQRLLQPRTWSRMALRLCATYSSQVYRIYIMLTGLTEMCMTDSDMGPDPENNPSDRVLPTAVSTAYGYLFGNYIRAYNATHPDAPMLHDDGLMAGAPIIPIY